MNIRSRKFGAVLALAAGASLANNPVLAQAASAQPVQKMEKFVVTGSYIPTTETAFTAGVSPVVRIDQKVIEESGLTNTAELLQKITVSNGGSVPISNNATGFTPAASSISLRGLGAEATLVLINGRRVASYPVGNGGTSGSLSSSSAITLAAGGALAFNLASGSSGLSFSNTITATAGAAINNLKTGNVLTLASSPANVTYGVLADETTATPTIANISFSATPTFSTNTINVVTTGYQSTFSSLRFLTWPSGSATGTVTLKMNGTTLASGSSGAGGQLSFVSSMGVVMGPGYFWYVNNNGTVTASTTNTSALLQASSMAFSNTSIQPLVNASRTCV